MGIGDRMGRKAAIARIAGKDWVIAEVLPAAQAIGAMTAGMTEPGNADAFAEAEPADVGADRIDPPDNLMPGNDRHLRIWQFPVDDMEIGAADAAGAHAHANLSGARLWIGQILVGERGSDLVQDHGFHAKCSKDLRLSFAR